MHNEDEQKRDLEREAPALLKTLPMLGMLLEIVSTVVGQVCAVLALRVCVYSVCQSVLQGCLSVPNLVIVKAALALFG